MRVRALVLRRPTFMEDEGRYFLEGQYASVAEAYEWVDSQEGEFFSGDDYIVFPIPPRLPSTPPPEGTKVVSMEYVLSGEFDRDNP